jgi:ABC-2 type transport system permease protein
MTVYALARHNLRITLREPGPALSRIVSPLALMILIQPLYRSALPGQDGPARATLLALVMFSTLGLSVVANQLLTERVWHTLDRLRATPLRSAALVAGKCATPLCILVIQQVVVFGTAMAAFGVRPRSPALLVLVGLTWAITVLCLGAALGALLSTPSAVSAATDLGSLLSTAFSGALLPLAAMPWWVREIAPFSPGYWVVRGYDGALHASTATALTSCTVLAGVSIVAAGFAAHRLTH